MQFDNKKSSKTFIYAIHYRIEHIINKSIYNYINKEQNIWVNYNFKINDIIAILGIKNFYARTFKRNPNNCFDVRNNVIS